MKGIVICVVGAKGAIGSSLALATLGLNQEKDYHKYLVTNSLKSFPDTKKIVFTGWDVKKTSFFEEIKNNELTSDYNFLQENENALKKLTIFKAPTNHRFVDRINIIKKDIVAIRRKYPEYQPILINVLPTSEYRIVGKTYNQILSNEQKLIDVAYVIAAIEEGIPVLNFTPNKLEVEAIISEAKKRCLPIAGRDGKTGQTYIKMAFASALRARNLFIQGWYSTNILGNSDGHTLMDAKKAKSKLENKTKILSNVLGYNPEAHIVKIDYYSPRKDAKEAWDVIDIVGMFGEKMGIRINLQGKDSVLATPIILDVARILAVSKEAKISGVLHELAFFFKTSIYEKPPYTYEDQILVLRSFLKRLSGVVIPWE